MVMVPGALSPYLHIPSDRIQSVTYRDIKEHVRCSRSTLSFPSQPSSLPVNAILPGAPLRSSGSISDSFPFFISHVLCISKPCPIVTAHSSPSPPVALCSKPLSPIAWKTDHLTSGLSDSIFVCSLVYFPYNVENWSKVAHRLLKI